MTASLPVLIDSHGLLKRDAVSPPERRQVEADIASTHALTDNGYCQDVSFVLEKDKL